MGVFGGFGSRAADLLRFGGSGTTTTLLLLAAATTSAATYVRLNSGSYLDAVDENEMRCRSLYHKHQLCKRSHWNTGQENHPTCVRLYNKLENECGKFKCCWSNWWTKKDDESFCCLLSEAYEQCMDEKKAARSKDYRKMLDLFCQG